MEFKVLTPDLEESFRGESTYTIGEANGVLVVHDHVGNSIRYSPAHWLRVEAEREDNRPRLVPDSSQTTIIKPLPYRP